MGSATRQARVFAALGDETRLRLVGRLSEGEQRSISELREAVTPGEDERGLTRQAVTKHLRVLERAGLVRCSRAGRERRFALQPEALDEMRDYLDVVATQWEEALGRLKELVEKGGD